MKGRHTMNAPQGFIGQSVERKRRRRFLTGAASTPTTSRCQGRPTRVRALALRARPHQEHRHQAAAAAPGVLGIFTGEHFKAVGGLPCGWLINSTDGSR
jgi:carbon-monoxide dehydrogenase large subunit